MEQWVYLKILLGVLVVVVVVVVFGFLFFGFFFFFCHIQGMLEFLGQGSILHHSSDLSCCNDNSYLTYCTAGELPLLGFIKDHNFKIIFKFE